MENKLYSLCNDLILILESLKDSSKISDEEFKIHLKGKLSYLQIYNEMDTAS